VLLVIDDFAPALSQRGKVELDAKAEGVLRGQGNLAGRERMNADTSLRPTYRARGLIGATGEDVPPGQSQRARTMINQLKPGDINPERLSALQDAARDGTLTEAMAALVRFLAAVADCGSFDKTLRKWQTDMRGDAAAEHRRTSENAASLMLGVQAFLAFAEQQGEIDAAEAERIRHRTWQALVKAAAAQGDEQREEDQVESFLDAIPEMLAAGTAHVATTDGRSPSNSGNSAFGWHIWNGVNDDEWRPQGNCIGYVDGDQLLLPDAAIGAANRLLSSQGRAVTINKGTLGKRLSDAGHLLTVGNDGRPAKPRWIGRTNVRVYVLSLEQVLGSNREPDLPYNYGAEKPRA
jgi:hypothetical protein